MESELAGVVTLKACDDAGVVIRELEIPIGDWYEELHPLIDESAARKAEAIRSIDGVQYDFDGSVMKRWRLEYDANGETTQSQELPLV